MIIKRKKKKEKKLETDNLDNCVRSKARMNAREVYNILNMGNSVLS